MHAFQLTFESSTNGACQAVHMDMIDDHVLEPHLRVELLVMLCDPFINTLC